MSASTNQVMPIIISLDGNIGAGKSTLLRLLETTLPEVTVVPEPVADWMSLNDGKGNSLLQLFYNDKNRWSYTFQTCALLTRITETEQVLKSFIHDGSKWPVVITERSVLTDRFVFAEMLHHHNDINDLEWTLYKKWFDKFAINSPSAVIYVTTGVKTSSERIKKRNRPGESSIPLEYLDQLDEQHEKWISSTDLPVLRVSTEDSMDMNEVVEQIKSFIQDLLANQN